MVHNKGSGHEVLAPCTILRYHDSHLKLMSFLPSMCKDIDWYFPLWQYPWNSVTDKFYSLYCKERSKINQIKMTHYNVRLIVPVDIL